jgi:hypothetical protein
MEVVVLRISNGNDSGDDVDDGYDIQVSLVPIIGVVVVTYGHRLGSFQSTWPGNVPKCPLPSPLELRHGEASRRS